MQANGESVAKASSGMTMPRSVVSRREALLALLALPMADVRVLAQSANGGRTGGAQGHLTVPLDQWATLSFRFKGQTKDFTTAELFAIIKGETK